MKTVKIITAFLTLIFSLNYGVAQTCKLDKNESDKFTKNRILHTEPIKINDGRIKLKRVYSINKVEMQLKYEENSHLIYLTYYFGMGLTGVTTNDKLILLLADDSIIEAPCVQNMPDQRMKMGAAVLSYHFKLNEDDFNKLTKVDITDIRMTAQINPLEFSVVKDYRTSNLFNCLNKNK